MNQIRETFSHKSPSRLSPGLDWDITVNHKTNKQTESNACKINKQMHEKHKLIIDQLSSLSEVITRLSIDTCNYSNSVN